jgi:hypothetical protein
LPSQSLSAGRWKCWELCSEVAFVWLRKSIRFHNNLIAK